MLEKRLRYMAKDNYCPGCRQVVKSEGNHVRICPLCGHNLDVITKKQLRAAIDSK